MPAASVHVDACLVRRLLAEQFPHWADLPLRPVGGGWDNRTFRLGDSMSVRLPSAEAYAAQVDKEQRWLPRLAPHLPLPIPAPLAVGRPRGGYPWPWSVYRWIEGEEATTARVDEADLATALGRFLVALQAVDPAGGPRPGRHCFFRGGPLRVYDAETRDALAALRGEVDGDAAAAAWEAALATRRRGAAVWVHGDVSAANLLVTRGRLGAVIDFGCCAVGDPACDVAIAWTHFSARGRAALRAALPLDDGAWTRGRGWALWKAVVTLAEHRGSDPVKAATARRTIEAVLGDARGGA
jgi:aminoglycoside phosphotransferase (APT) family kinase protein